MHRAIFDKKRVKTRSFVGKFFVNFKLSTEVIHLSTEKHNVYAFVL